MKISYKWEENNRIKFVRNPEWMAEQTWVIHSQTAQPFLFHRNHDNDGKASPNIRPFYLVGQNLICFITQVHMKDR